MPACRENSSATWFWPEVFVTIPFWQRVREPFSNMFGGFLGQGPIVEVSFCRPPKRVPKVKISHTLSESLFEHVGVSGETFSDVFFGTPLGMAFWTFYVQKWLPKDFFWELFWRLFGDPKAMLGKCDL